MLPFFRRNRSIKHCRQKALHTGQWRTQVMRNICNKILLHLLMRLQAFRHVVKALRQLTQFIRACHIHALLKIPICNNLCRTVHPHQRQRNIFRRHIADNQPQKRNEKQADYANLVHFLQGFLNLRQGTAHQNSCQMSLRKRISDHQHGRIGNLSAFCLYRNDFSILHTLNQCLADSVIPQKFIIKPRRGKRNLTVLIDNQNP